MAQRGRTPYLRLHSPLVTEPGPAAASWGWACDSCQHCHHHCHRACRAHSTAHNLCHVRTSPLAHAGPTQPTESLEQPFYIRTSVSFLMWQHVRGRAQLPPLMDCLPCLVSPLNNRLHPTSPGKPGLCEGGRQSRDMVRRGQGEGRQAVGPSGDPLALTFPLTAPAPPSLQGHGKNGALKKSFQKLHKCNANGRNVGVQACLGKLPSETRGTASQIWKLLRGGRCRRWPERPGDRTERGGTTPHKIFPAGRALALRPGTGSWWPRHCLVTSLWPGNPGQEAPVWTAHPCEGCPHQATHRGAI